MLQFDKTIKAHTQEVFMERLANERFYGSTDIEELLDRVFGLTSKYGLIVHVVRAGGGSLCSQR